MYMCMYVCMCVYIYNVNSFYVLLISLYRPTYIHIVVFGLHKGLNWCKTLQELGGFSGLGRYGVVGFKAP